MVYKTDICIALGKKKHFQDHVHINVYQQEDLFKEIKLFGSIIYLKNCNYYFKNLYDDASNFLNFYISFSDNKTKFFYISKLYNINLTT